MTLRVMPLRSESMSVAVMARSVVVSSTTAKGGSMSSTGASLTGSTVMVTLPGGSA